MKPLCDIHQVDWTIENNIKIIVYNELLPETT